MSVRNRGYTHVMALALGADLGTTEPTAWGTALGKSHKDTLGDSIR